MLEPENNPNPSFIGDPPGWLRRLMSRRVLGREADATVPEAGRNKAESRRRRRGAPHVVWKAMAERNQDEMVDGLGLWGVPSYRLFGPKGGPDLAVWGQDRLWLVAAEIVRRAS